MYACVLRDSVKDNRGSYFRPQGIRLAWLTLAERNLAWMNYQPSKLVATIKNAGTRCAHYFDIGNVAAADWMTGFFSEK